MFESVMAWNADGADQLPVVEARTPLDFLDTGNENRRGCSFYLSIMNRWP